MGWTWTLKRIVLSAFVVAHLGAVVLWIVPDCALKRYTAVLPFYLMPLGQWQYWGMFAPEPIKHTLTLEATAVDRHGLRHTFLFPREADFSTWGSIWHYRHSKYTANFGMKDDFKAQREFGARHVLRQLKLPADSYPVEVHIAFLVRTTPPPGGPPPDPMSPPVSSPIESYRFPTLAEAMP